jgi:Thiamine-binding protein
VSGSGYGTNIEGPWVCRCFCLAKLWLLKPLSILHQSAVSDAIHACHVAVHAKGAPRIATDIRIGTRVDREITVGQANEDKIKRVEDILRLEK